jgi:formiminoglutamase
MTDIFKLTDRPQTDLFFRRTDSNDVRLGEIVSSTETAYQAADVVILGCPQDDGVIRNRGRSGAASAPDEIRRAFYKLTNFGVRVNIFDLGNTKIQPALEETHEFQIKIVRQLIRDGKKVISLGGGNDISYPDCRALAEETDAGKLLAFNIDAHFDVRADVPRNSGTPYRQLLEENLISPQNFYEIGWQKQANSAIYFEYLRNKGANLIDLEALSGMLAASEFGDLPALSAGTAGSVFWGFDVDSVRASDAPGVSAPNPLGLSASEFCRLAEYAGQDSRTKIIEFTELNPNFDIDGRTARLVATAIHRFCSAVS